MNLNLDPKLQRESAVAGSMLVSRKEGQREQRLIDDIRGIEVERGEALDPVYF
ncbi:hypothetical protein WN48_03302 [Eufriesea mexicana]|uniref:Uncharacterized protein n=1 Tax=Eufriesea mexicana TaxID=516756 RepID=A0A310SNH6_9HYME|nr:hypothetical protein WN48_03302 [Eufriesea mexicana]